jgi:hypothetical protein
MARTEIYGASMRLPCGTERREVGRWRSVGRFAAVAAAVLLLSSCSSRSSRETVTTELGRQPAIASDAKPVALSPRLPERDAEVEAAGDRVAAAITHVKHRRAAAALRALGEAQAGAKGAMSSPARGARDKEVLAAAVAGMQAAERAIQRGSWAEATVQLTAANKGLDSLHTLPVAAP